jgi:hypothetical protein
VQRYKKSLVRVGNVGGNGRREPITVISEGVSAGAVMSRRERNRELEKEWILGEVPPRCYREMPSPL